MDRDTVAIMAKVVSGDEKRRPAVMAAVLLGLAGVVVVATVSHKSPARPVVAVVPLAGTVAVVVTPVWGERLLSYSGRFHAGEWRTWAAEEYREAGGVRTSVGHTRVKRWSADGREMVRVVAFEEGGRHADTGDLPWVGDGEYIGTLTDERTGAKSVVKVRVELPTIHD